MTAPTATLTQPSNITAVSSARKTLVVTYTVGDACSQLVLTFPNTALPCTDCPFIVGPAFVGDYTFPILVDGEGQRYCDPSDPSGPSSNTTLQILFDDMPPSTWANANATNVSEISSGEFLIDSGLTGDLCDYTNCQVKPTYPDTYVWSEQVIEGMLYGWLPWTGSVGAYYTRATQESDAVLSVRVQIYYGSGSAQVTFRHQGDPYEILQAPIPLYSQSGGWFDTSNATALLSMSGELRIQPNFDAEGRLSSVDIHHRPEGGQWSLYTTYYPNAPADCAALASGVTLTGGGYSPQLPDTITASVANAIDYSTLATGNIRVTGPLGYDEIGTLVSVDTESDGTPRVATYSIPPPEGNIWCWQYNGTYTVSMVADEVSDLAGNYVAAGTLGTFACDIDGEPILEPLFLAGYLMAATETLVFPMYADDESALVDDVTPTVLIRTTGGSWVSPTSGPTNDGNGFYTVTVTNATHFATYGTLQLLATAAGCRPTTQAYKAGPIAADTQAIDGDFNAASYDREDLVNGYAHGEVADESDVDYDYDYGADCTPTTTVFCVKDLPLREDSAEDDNGVWRYGYAKQFIRIEDNPTWKRILKSVTYGSITEITLENPLYEAPAVGAAVTIGGCTEFSSEV